MSVVSLALGFFALFANVSALRTHNRLLEQHVLAHSNDAVLVSVHSNIRRAWFRILAAILTLLASILPEVIFAIVFILQSLLVAASVSDWFAARRAAEEVST